MFIRVIVGRNSHVKLADNFAEVFVKKQSEEMLKVMTEQMRMFDNAINVQLENQRKWEEEMMEKEHRHQIMIMENFMQKFGATQTTNFPYTQFAPIPMHTFQSTSSTQNLYPYQLSPSPSLSRSPTPSSPFSVVPSPTPSNSSSYNYDSDKSKHV